MVLVSGQDCLARLDVLKRAAEASVSAGVSLAILASGEVFGVRDTTIHAQVFNLDQSLKEFGVRVIRLTPGCVCCSSKLIVQTHLSRLMRLNQPDVLLLELDSQSHVDQVIEWVKSEQWSDWFAKVSIQDADN